MRGPCETINGLIAISDTDHPRLVMHHRKHRLPPRLVQVLGLIHKHPIVFLKRGLEIEWGQQHVVEVNQGLAQVQGFLVHLNAVPHESLNTDSRRYVLTKVKCINDRLPGCLVGIARHSLHSQARLLTERHYIRHDPRQLPVPRRLLPRQPNHLPPVRGPQPLGDFAPCRVSG